MCILLVAYQHHPDYDLVVAANRDEFYDRPSAPAAYWSAHPTLLAGQDLQAGGTWLGVNARGHFSAVTNLRGALTPTAGYSRGHLVRDYLVRPDSSEDFLVRLAPDAGRYAACNLVLCDAENLYWWSNLGKRVLNPGVYGISNTHIDHEWPKVERLKGAFAPLRGLTGASLTDSLLALLRDTERSSPTGTAKPLNFARVEETIFVHTPSYGTRCSSIVLRNRRLGRLEFIERRYGPDTQVVGEARYSIDSVN